MLLPNINERRHLLALLEMLILHIQRVQEELVHGLGVFIVKGFLNRLELRIRPQ